MNGAFDFDVIFRSWQYLFLVGMSFTLKLTALAMVGGIVFGTIYSIISILKMIRLLLFILFWYNVFFIVRLILLLPFTYGYL